MKFKEVFVDLQLTHLELFRLIKVGKKEEMYEF
jgi:hypothetical protein